MGSPLFQLDLLTAHEPEIRKCLEINECIFRFLGRVATGRVRVVGAKANPRRSERERNSAECDRNRRSAEARRWGTGQAGENGGLRTDFLVAANWCSPPSELPHPAGVADGHFATRTIPVVVIRGAWAQGQSRPARNSRGRNVPLPPPQDDSCLS